MQSPIWTHNVFSSWTTFNAVAGPLRKPAAPWYLCTNSSTSLSPPSPNLNTMFNTLEEFRSEGYHVSDPYSFSNKGFLYIRELSCNKHTNIFYKHPRSEGHGYSVSNTCRKRLLSSRGEWQKYHTKQRMHIKTDCPPPKLSVNSGCPNLTKFHTY